MHIFEIPLQKGLRISLSVADLDGDIVFVERDAFDAIAAGGGDYDGEVLSKDLGVRGQDGGSERRGGALQTSIVRSGPRLPPR